MEFVSRAAWGAKYAAGFGARDLPLDEAWLHHTVTLAPDLAFTDLNADSVDDDEAAAMRTVERIGQQRFGAGFSYNLAVMPSGRLYVGCGVRRVGAHTKGRNTRALGVVLVGDYSRQEVPQPMQDALVALLQYGHKQERLTRPAFTGGHRDAPGASTACPGAKAWRLLPTLNARAAGAPVTIPDPAAPAALTAGGPAVIIVLHPDGRRQYLCDRANADHIGMPERNVLTAAGVPYVGDKDASAADRGEFLARRGITA